MSVSRASHRRTLSFLLPASALGLLLATACVADRPGISDDETAGTDAGGGGEASSSAGAGSGAVAGTSSDAAGAPSATAGTGQAGSGAAVAGGGTGGSDIVDTGGTAANVGEGGQINGEGGQAEGGEGPTPVAMSCLFHTDATAEQGTGGTGGAGPAATVVLQTNAFVGGYLTDTAGRTLYTYGGDLPGDCQTAPVSTCTADCLVSWPAFDAGSRVLGAGLDDAAFGAIDRGDGTWQTTYYGWPLYYYKSDLTLGQLTGQGKGKTWHAAEVTLPSVVVMKAGMAKYLADGKGHTLYVSAADQAGTAAEDPVSTCEEDCLDTFTPFREKHLSVVTSLEEADFSVFVRRSAGGLQLAYKGLPLYSASTDLKSGDMTGVNNAGFTAAVP